MNLISSITKKMYKNFLPWPGGSAGEASSCALEGWGSIPGIILIHSHKTTIVLDAVIFLFGNISEKRSVSLTKKSGTACFKILQHTG